MKKISILLILLLTFSCSKDDSGNPSPVAALLIFPDNNQECNQGVEISTTQSTVTFRWAASNNTDS